jgi:hypothetical protein
MTLAKFEWMLAHQALYFARGDRFEDPYEGQLPDEIMASIKSNNADSSVYEMWRQFGKNSQRETYLNCWYGSPHESAAMWKLYSGDDGAGVAIVSQFASFVASFEPTAEAVHVGLVKYGDEHLTSQKTIGNGFDYWLWKRRPFEHEREVRAVIWHPVSGGGVIVRKDG